MKEQWQIPLAFYCLQGETYHWDEARCRLVVDEGILKTMHVLFRNLNLTPIPARLPFSHCGVRIGTEVFRDTASLAVQKEVTVFCWV